MTRPRSRAAAGLLVALLAGALSACGGFGTKEPQTLDTTIRSYVALGDGFAAAPYAGKATSNDGCLRTAGGYPQKVATSLAVADFKNVSCVGASTRAITGRYVPPGAKAVPAQIDAVTKDTDLVTITVGISDHNLIYGMFNICPATPCGPKVIANDLAAQLKKLSTELPATIRAVTARAPHAYVVVVGYPELMPFENGCKALPKMNASQWFYSNQAWRSFTGTVSSAARQAGAAFVDAQRLSAAHPPCTDDPWVNGATSVKGRSVGFHPKAVEEQAVAQAVLAQVRTR